MEENNIKTGGYCTKCFKPTVNGVCEECLAKAAEELKKQIKITNRINSIEGAKNLYNKEFEGVMEGDATYSRRLSAEEIMQNRYDAYEYLNSLNKTELIKYILEGNRYEERRVTSFYGL